MNKPYELTDKDKDRALGEAIGCSRFPSLEDCIAQAAQKKLLEYLISKTLAMSTPDKDNDTLYLCTSKKDWQQLLKDFGL